MKALKTKLQSQKGASLILAAVYFLICAFVGGTVLAAATSGSAHLKDRKADEQTFLIQRSAARVIEQELTVADGYLQAEMKENIAFTTELDGFKKLVAEAAYIQYLGDEVTDGSVPYGDLVLTMSETSVSDGKSDTVDVHYEVGDNYDLTVTLSQNGDSRLHVFMKASVSESTRGEVTTTTVTWNEPIIRKGGGAA